MKTSKNRIRRISAPSASDAEFQRWMSKYLPVEREIMAERDRREERRWQRRHQHREALARAFGDLCEATEGRAVRWQEDGFCAISMAVEIATDAWTRKTADRYSKLSGKELPRLPCFNEVVSSLIMLHFILSLNISAVVSCCALQLVVHLTGIAIKSLKHRAIRPLYYERETARRRALAADRRRICKRTTVNACPTKEAILDAYIHRKDSKESAILFGSLIHDLECYVDNSLRFTEGRISGRNQGVKGWLAENIPALVCKYTTVMRYKAMAKKLKQLTELEDPHPAETVLGGGDFTASAETVPDEKVLRGVAIYRELAEGVGSATSMMAKIDAFLDPTRVEEATMLAVWREKYANEITVRNKSRWWRRFVLKRRRQDESESGTRKTGKHMARKDMAEGGETQVGETPGKGTFTLRS